MYVTIENVSKTIKGKQVLCEVNTGFERGRIYGVVGPNGSGKTMLLRAICGFIHVDTGTVSMNGKSVEFNRKLPDSVGVIIENPGFVLSETGMQNLKYLAGINKDFDSDETERLLKEFGLWEHADEKNEIIFAGHASEAGHCAGADGASESDSVGRTDQWFGRTVGGRVPGGNAASA